MSPAQVPFAWSLPLLLGAAYAVSFADRTLVAVAGASISHDLNLTDLQFGLLSGTAFVLLYTLVSVPLGLLADRVSRRWLIVLGLLTWSIMTAWCGLAQSFTSFGLARVGVGLGEATLMPAGMSLIRSRLPPDQSGRAVAIFLIGATLGNGLAHLIGGVVLLRLGADGVTALPLIGPVTTWRLLFFATALMGFPLALMLLRVHEPARDTAPCVREQLARAWTQLYRHRRAYVPLTLAAACGVALSQSYTAWLPLYYVRTFSVSPGQSAFLVGIIILAIAPLGQFLSGALIDRLRVAASPNLVLAGSAALSILPCLVFCTTSSLSLSLAAYAMFLFFVSAASPGGLAGWQQLTPVSCAGLVIAALGAVVSLLGIGIGPVLIGLLTEYVFRDEQALGSAVLVVLVAAGTLACLFALTGRQAYIRAMAHGPEAADRCAVLDQRRSVTSIDCIE